MKKISSILIGILLSIICLETVFQIIRPQMLFDTLIEHDGVNMDIKDSFIYKFFKTVKNEKLLLTIEIVVFSLLLIGLTLFSALDYQVNLDTVYRILIPVVSFTLLGLTLFTQIFVSKFFKKREIDINVMSVGFACFVIEMTIMVAFGVAMKYWAFAGSTFLIILVSQIIVAFFNIPLNTFLVSYIMYLSNKLIRQREAQ